MLFALLTVILYSPSHLRSKYRSAESRISLRSNITRRKANITEKSNCKMQLLFSWLVAPKKISPDFLKNPLVTRLFRTFFIFFLAPCNGLRSFLSNFIENRKRYHPNQVNFISPKVCSSGSKYPDSISWNGMCFFAKDEPSCPQYSSTSLRTSE